MKYLSGGENMRFSKFMKKRLENKIALLAQEKDQHVNIICTLCQGHLKKSLYFF
jgi:hypothetical protein